MEKSAEVKVFPMEVKIETIVKIGVSIANPGLVLVGDEAVAVTVYVFIFSNPVAADNLLSDIVRIGGIEIGILCAELIRGREFKKDFCRQ